MIYALADDSRWASEGWGYEGGARRTREGGEVSIWATEAGAQPTISLLAGSPCDWQRHSAHQRKGDFPSA